ncbi:uncharacterized protein LOC8284665 [Ricinus communis]|uniref:Uncharacterized protein n=1 Tax=Ricinus communis TaxID=3988 RepID=B9S5S2_RICCO|nr:uncharacterized protein LOC8284665 [Ricinus communis]EEF41009.1 conserved hypothetical protein [Ricinus communis]|eukprot:XP_002521341.1 uncharacterized protein LOC8284665 [Ricinus communis]
MRPPPPPSLHSNFFSSLKQVEKRLKLESPTKPSSFSPPPGPPPNIKTNYTSTESLSTPIYLQEESNSNSSTTPQESSEAPLAFLSSSPSQFLPNPPEEEQSRSIHEDGVDDIQLLMQVLGLSDIRKRNKGQQVEGNECCECEGGFYEKIVGVKGPKCKIEMDRLERWIDYFLHNSECGAEGRMEPLRLAFLLLGRATFELDTGLDFPSTIEDFLKYDPPRE